MKDKNRELQELNDFDEDEITQTGCSVQDLPPKKKRNQKRKNIERSLFQKESA
jgi:hypothetical protein